MSCLRKIIQLLVLVFPAMQGFSQDDDAKALELMKGAFASLTEKSSYAIHFEGIAYNIRKPQEIFSLPVYEVYRGGYLYAEGDKFEIQLGIMKALSDGNLYVVVDEQQKMMMVDSLREKVPGDFGQVPDIEKLVEDEIGEGTYKYEGVETVNSTECHRIRAAFPGDASVYILYWIEKKTGKLLMFAEWQGSGYDVYWVKKIGRAPKGYKYDINLPDNELEEFYGYEVFDFRYTSQYLKKQEY